MDMETTSLVKMEKAAEKMMLAADKMDESRVLLSEAIEKQIHVVRLECQIEMMKSENRVREMQGLSPAYWEDEFGRLLSEFDSAIKHLG